MSIQDTIEKLVDAKIAKASQGGVQSVLAEYKGTDSQGKGWVVIAGSTESTPVTRATVEASEGDTVSVTVGDGKCVMDANISNPSAGVAGVKKASQTAQQALEDANTAVTYSAIASDAAAAAKVSAEDAQQTADAVHGMAEQALNDATAASTAAATAQAAAEDAQDSLMSVVSGATTVEKAVSVMQTALEAVVDYDPQNDTVQEWFWHDANGAHVLGDTSGYRNDITSSGMDIKTVSDERSVAQFGADGARIGRDYDSQASDNESHIELDYHSMRFIDKEGGTYFHVSDLRGRDGYATLTETFDGTGSKTEFLVNLPARSVETTSVETSDSQAITVVSIESRYHREITVSPAPSAGSTVYITYQTNDPLAKAYTFGQRLEGSTIGVFSVTEGSDTTASGYYSHAEGYKTAATREFSHAEGSRTLSSGIGSHAEGNRTTSSSTAGHAEGEDTVAEGYASHAEGYNTTALKGNGHSEGYYTVARGQNTHAEGDTTEAIGQDSHTEGRNTITRAYGLYSHAQNDGTIAYGRSQTVLGTFNAEGDIYQEPNTHRSNSSYYSQYAVILGNGTADDDRTNALTVDWSGNVGIAGDVRDMSGNAKYVPRSGGIMTGSIYMRNTEIDRDAANPSSKQYGQKMVIYRDTNDENIGYIQPVRTTDGKIGMQISPVNEKSDGTAATGAFTILVDKSGNTSYEVNGPANFRSAIGLTTSVTSSLTNTGVTITAKSGFTVTVTSVRSYGNVRSVFGNIKSTSAWTAGQQINPFTTNLYSSVVSSDFFHGDVAASGNAWIRVSAATSANTARDFTMVGIL